MFNFINKLLGRFADKELRSRYDDLHDRHERLLDSYEELSAKYFDALNPIKDRIPGMHFCSRKEREVYAFFRVHGDDRFPQFSKFLSGLGWNPDITIEGVFETGEPVYCVRTGNGVKVYVPDGSVLLVNRQYPMSDYFIVPEEIFHDDWNIFG